MTPKNTQSQALMLLQNVMQKLKNRRVRSVLQCAAMGAFAFCVMLLVYRFSLSLPLFGIAGFSIASVLGGIAGALVRYYFVKVDEEDLYRDTGPAESLGEKGPPEAQHLENQDRQDAHALMSQSTEPHCAAETIAAIPEADAADIPKQIEMFPSLHDVEEPREPVHIDIPGELALLRQRGKSEQHQGTACIEGQFLSCIMEHSRIFCVVVNPQDEIVMINHFMTESLGYSAEELWGKSFTANLIPPRLRREAWTGLSGPTAEPTESISIQSHLWTKDGREVPVEWHGTAVFDATDTLLSCFLLGIDITERKQREEALEESRLHYQTLYADATNRLEYFRAVLDSSVEPMVVFDMQGKATYVNPAFVELFGWTVDELQDHDSSFVPVAQRDLEKPFLDGLMEKGIPCKNLDTKRQSKDGSLVSTRMTASLIRDHKGLPSGTLVTLRGLVERTKGVKESAKPASQPKKRQVNAKDMARDILSGASDAQLMEKYRLTAKGLHSVFQKLIEAKVLKPSEIVRRSAAYDETVAIELSRIVPLEKPAPQPKVSKPAKAGPPVPAVTTGVHSLHKFGLTEDNLEDLVKELLPHDVSRAEPKAPESSLNTQELEDLTARRAMPRHYMVVSVPIYESTNLLTEGTIIDISEQGLKVQGIDTLKGETKSLLIQGDEFHDVYPFIFDAVCCWATTDEATGDTVAGFQITAISDTSIEELRKLIGALSIGS